MRKAAKKMRHVTAALVSRRLHWAWPKAGPVASYWPEGKTVTVPGLLHYQ